MSWSRTDAVAAIVAALQQTMGEAVFVHAKTPQTINPPAIVVSRPLEVRYSSSAFSIDEASISVICVGPADGEDVVDGLITQVRQSFPDPSLGGVVASCRPTVERNWRNVSIAGVDILQAEVVLTVDM
jgi:hypothetical protein